MPDEWIDFAIDIWKTETRRSERAKDSVRNPRDKTDKKLYRVHWLEVRIGDIHELIVREGRRKFDRPATESTEAIEAVEEVQFHFSWWYVTKVRPFFVKDGGREVCVCVYHLRFDVFIETLFNYIKRLRTNLKLCKCEHTNHKHPIDFRRAHVCARETSERYDEVRCATNICASCKDLNMFKLCECDARTQLPPIKAQVWTNIDYTRKDGTQGC